MNLPHEINSCEVCGNTELRPALNLGRHPLCDDLVPIGDSRICVEYPIEILFCPACATAHQRFQVPKRDLFPPSYHYRSRFTADVLNGMRALVSSCEKRLGGLSGKMVLDIGCNDGSLLDFFREKGCTTVGIEPTDAYADGLNKGHRIYNLFFSEASAARIVEAHGKPDLITFTNVFAHIENLPDVVTALKCLMGSGTAVVIENHYLGSVLDGYQFDTFYHEHPRTYSLSSFVHIAKDLGVPLSGVEFPARYGGNIRVFMGGGNGVEDSANEVVRVLDEETGFGGKLFELQDNVERWKIAMGGRIASLAETQGILSAKAFPGRAAILIKLLGIDSDVIGQVYEKPGSMKIGHYLPGTRIPIKSDDELFSLPTKPSVMINLAWHISPEINAYLTQHGYHGNIVDILDSRDFAV